MNIEQLSPETFKALEHFRLNFWKDLIKNDKHNFEKFFKLKCSYNPVILINGRMYSSSLFTLAESYFDGYIFSHGASFYDITMNQSAKKIACENYFWLGEAVKLLGYKS